MDWQHWGRGICACLLLAAGAVQEVRADDLAMGYSRYGKENYP